MCAHLAKDRVDRRFSVLATVLATSLIGMTCIPAPVYGQGTPVPGDAPALVPLRLGPVALAPALTFTYGWDSNVFQQTVDGGDRPSTVRAIARPELDAWLRAGRARIHGRSTWDAVYYRDYDSENSVDSSHEVRLDFPLARLIPYVSGQWVDASQHFGFEINDRIRRNEDHRGAGVAVRIGSRTDIDISARRARLDFDRTETFRDPFRFEFYDYTSKGVSMTVRREMTPLTSLAVTIDRYEDRFDIAPGRPTNGLAITTGFDFKPLAVISGSAYVGWRRVHLADPGSPTLEGVVASPTFDGVVASPTFDGVVASVDLAYTLLGATRFTVQGIRDVQYGAQRGSHAYLLAGVGATVTHRINETWDIGVRAGSHELSYGLFDFAVVPGDESPAASVGRNREMVTDYGGNVGYRVGRGIRVGFGIGHQYRRSTFGAARGYQQTLAEISLSLRP
jgi:hypothetical protein